ncbi:MAG: hypothetical protein A2583_15810 [Bdellovibrionales bacterium RIFOXYD1_FULL_53_11]|nr:MAG: hypothetical protein A2583_15810 [Bdellovibrionales bacterium RIFOXYD1_FULL_53_11]
MFSRFIYNGVRMDIERIFEFIPGRWKKPEEFRQEVDVLGIKLFLSGFSSSNGAMELVGSSAGMDRHEPERSAFELLERITTVEAEESGLIAFDKLDGICRYSKSNGIAIHTDKNTALQKSYFEVVERDRVLRSWFGDIANPVVLRSCPDVRLLGRLEPLAAVFDLRVFEFVENLSRSKTFVHGFFGLPKNDNAACFFGFGADSEESASIAKAVGEGLQRLGFTWGEKADFDPAAFKPTAIDHLLYYHDPARNGLIRRWCSNGNGRYLKFIPHEPPRCVWNNIALKSMQDRIYAYQCKSDDLLPLTFGFDHPYARGLVPDEIRVHPLA